VIRAPFPKRPSNSLAKLLREALAKSRSDIWNDQYQQAYARLEFHTIRTIADLETWSADQWDEIVRELEQARPK
jgi:hypothetical protein